MTLTTEQLDRLERRAAGVVAQLPATYNRNTYIDADTLLALVSAYRNAMQIRREIERALLGHDLESIKNAAHQLPTDDRPLWEKD